MSSFGGQTSQTQPDATVFERTVQSGEWSLCRIAPPFHGHSPVSLSHSTRALQTLRWYPVIAKTSTEEQRERERDKNEPVMVPWTMVPFLSSIVTVSLPSFIKNLDARPVAFEFEGGEKVGFGLDGRWAGVFHGKVLEWNDRGGAREVKGKGRVGEDA